MKIATIALLSLLAAECPAKPSPAPVGDAAPDNGSCAAACSNLRGLGCKEGLADNCVATCEHVEATRLTELHPTCLTRAATKAEARLCGSVSCPE